MYIYIYIYIYNIYTYVYIRVYTNIQYGETYNVNSGVITQGSPGFANLDFRPRRQQSLRLRAAGAAASAAESQGPGATKAKAGAKDLGGPYLVAHHT